MTSAPAAGIGLRLFGDVSVDGKSLPGRRAKALLLALAMAKGRAVAPASLIDEVWGLDAPANAATALHTMVSRIRSGHSRELITSSSAGYALGMPTRTIDYWAARNLLDDARASLAHAPGTSLELLGNAAALTDGEPAAGTAASPALDDFTVRAGQLRGSMDKTLAEALLATGRPADAAALLQPLLAAGPMDEPLHGLYFRALSASGQANTALAGYDQLSRRLRRELGTGPSPVLQQLHAGLLRETDDAGTPPSSDIAPAAVPREAGAGRGAHSFGIRSAPNELVGRTGDLAAVGTLLRSSRLTTILGTGGLGKTRMALELANRAAGEGKSVIVLELAGIRTSDDIWLALAEGAGIREARSSRTLQDGRLGQDLRSRTLARLSAGQVLLVVDNCEHLVGQVAAVIAEILAACPDASVLATSRAPLSIAGESVYQLQPLATGGPSDTAIPAAVELFTRRAMAARGSVRLDPAVVRSLCEHLDGLPLAIELAAARVRMMSVEDIARRLTAGMDQLVNTDRSAPARHRSLTAVINWSWELLTDTDRTVMRRLSCFPSGFSLGAACATAACLPDPGLAENSPTNGAALTLAAEDVEAAVEALVNQSLVLSEEDPSTGTVRFRMLETVREYAAAQLAAMQETAAVEAALTGWAVEFSLQALSDSAGPAQLATLRRTTAEQENLLHALRSAMAAGGPGSADRVYAIFGLLASYWSQRGMHSEVYEFAGTILAATKDYIPSARTADAAVFSLSTLALTTMVFNLRQGAAVRSRLRRIVAAALPLAPRNNAMAQVILAIGNDARVVGLLAELRMDPRDDVAALALLMSGVWAENMAEPEQAVRYAEKSFRLSEKLQDTWSAGSAADNAAELYSQGAQPGPAVKWARLAAERMALVGAWPDVASATLTLALNLAALGDPDAAEAALHRLHAMDPGESRTELAAMETVAAAEIQFARGHDAEGLRLYRSVQSQRRAERSNGPMGQILQAARICAEVLYNPGVADTDATVRDVGRLRRSVIASRRRSPRFMDMPVLGTLSLAVGAWHARLAAPGTRRAGVGLELMVLAGILKGRQDETVLVRKRHNAAARDRHGAAALTAVEAAVAANVRDPARAVERVLELLSDPSLRES